MLLRVVKVMTGQSMLYSKDDFFDAISRDASDRGEPRQNRFANQRKVDVEV